MEWIVWDCETGEEIYRAMNGTFAQATAEQHKEKTGHKVIVGFYAK